MRKFFIILLAIIAISCSNDISEKDIIGKYKVTMSVDVDPDDEAGNMALGMLASADIKYEFLKGGKLNTSISMGVFGEEDEEGTWSLRKDSIFIDKDSYFIEKSDNGFVLTSAEVKLTFSEID